MSFIFNSSKFEFFVLIASNCSIKLASSRPKLLFIAVKSSFNFLTISNCLAVSCCDNNKFSFDRFNSSIFFANAVFIFSPNPSVSI